MLEWANVSDYMRIPGMGKAKVGLVRAAGVTTVRELALRNPARLAQNMKEVNTKRKLVRVLPSEKSVEQLIAQARKLQPKSAISDDRPAPRPRNASGAFPRHASMRGDMRLNADPSTPMRGPRKATAWPRPVNRLSRPRRGFIRCSQALLSRPTPAVMGVLNVTPDSFSDGGRFLAPDQALAQARRLIADGADIIDIGAESTRPYGGAQPVSAETEWRRLAAGPRRIVALGVPVSIDSMKAEVVALALDDGAAIANDVWGLQRDPRWRRWWPRAMRPSIVMHNRERVDPAIDIMQDIAGLLRRARSRSRREAGIPAKNIVLDPGIGFGKTQEQSMIALARLDELQHLRPAASGRGLAQKLHRLGLAVRAAATARRLDRGASDRRPARRADHPNP